MQVLGSSGEGFWQAVRCGKRTPVRPWVTQSLHQTWGGTSVSRAVAVKAAWNVPRKSLERARTGTSQAAERGESPCMPSGASAKPFIPVNGRALLVSLLIRQNVTTETNGIRSSSLISCEKNNNWRQIKGAFQ